MSEILNNQNEQSAQSSQSVNIAEIVKQTLEAKAALEENKEKKDPRVRVFEIVQYEFNPKTGEDLHFNENNLKEGFETHATIKRWAWICHDKDPYTEEEEAKGLGKAGTLKPKHWHGVGECPCSVKLSAIAKWFGVPPQQIELPKGRGAFLDKVQYLTHERTKQQEKGKHLYEDEEVHANFDFRKELDVRDEKRLKYGSDLTPKEEMRYDVMYNGWTLRQCIAKDRLLYIDDIDKLKKLRLEYISLQNPPRARINYFICGKGGIGKGLLSRAIARNLYPQYDDDNDIFFEVGSKGSAFDGYDGQPVIIWNDRRAVELLQELGGRGNVFEVFDTHPSSAKQNIKYSSVKLCNEVNIVNSVENYKSFLDGLAGEYVDKNGRFHEAEDKSQSCRRFPFLIPIHADDIDVLINLGFMNQGTYEQYELHKTIIGNMQKIRVACAANERLAKAIEAQTVKPIVDKHHEIVTIGDNEPTEGEIKTMFADYGTEKNSRSLIPEPGPQNADQAKDDGGQVNLIEYAASLENGYDFDTPVDADDFYSPV